MRNSTFEEKIEFGRGVLLDLCQKHYDKLKEFGEPMPQVVREESDKYVWLRVNWGDGTSHALKIAKPINEESLSA